MSTSSGGQAIDGAGEWNRARNQALIREMNEQVTAMAGTTPDDQVLVICECGDVRCAVPVSVTRTEYERVRASATQFVVKPGHELQQGESFVGEYAEFAVVENLAGGAGSRLVGEQTFV
jgi:hypothetical protein